MAYDVFTPLTKGTRTTSKLARDVNKYERRQTRARAKATADREESRRFAIIAEAAYQRDGGCCRVTGKPLKFRHGHPLGIAHPHHIKYRSAGGTDDLSNILTVSPEVHEDIHSHIRRRIDVEGNANAVVTVRIYHAETGRLLREFESRPVKACEVPA